MRRLSLGFALAVLMVMAIPAVGAELHGPHVGTSCGPDEHGVWHFVNNQTEGAEFGELYAVFDNDDVTVTPAKVNRNVMHFYVVGGGSIVSASTGDLPGKLVLSDFECLPGKKKPRPA